MYMAQTAVDNLTITVKQNVRRQGRVHSEKFQSRWPLFIHWSLTPRAI